MEDDQNRLFARKQVLRAILDANERLASPPRAIDYLGDTISPGNETVEPSITHEENKN